MASLRLQEIARLVGVAKSSTASRKERGVALEQLVNETFGRVPGMKVAGENLVNAFKSEELDRMLQIKRCADVPFAGQYVLVECKNWAKKVDSQTVEWFDSKLRRRSGLACEGILIAANGVTGTMAGRTSANHIIAQALAEGRRIVVVSIDDIAALTTTDDAIDLLEQRLTILAGELGQL